MCDNKVILVASLSGKHGEYHRKTNGFLCNIKRVTNTPYRWSCKRTRIYYTCTLKICICNRSLCVLPGLTFRNYTFRPQSASIMSPIWISQQTATCPHTQLIGVYNRDECVYYA